MGFFGKIGKAISRGVRSVGKTVGAGARAIGKVASGAAKFVRGVGSKITRIPFVGPVAEAFWNNLPIAGLVRRGIQITEMIGKKAHEFADLIKDTDSLLRSIEKSGITPQAVSRAKALLHKSLNLFREAASAGKEVLKDGTVVGGIKKQFRSQVIGTKNKINRQLSAIVKSARHAVEGKRPAESSLDENSAKRQYIRA